jgi:hypothetical protein
MARNVEMWTCGSLDDSDSDSGDEDVPEVLLGGGALSLVAWDGLDGSAASNIPLSEKVMRTIDLADVDITDILSQSSLSELWIDNCSVLSVLGSALCEHLEQFVSHEAVHYLQEVTQQNLVIQRVAVSALGKRRTISIEPSQKGALSVPVGRVFRTSLTFVNKYSALAELSADLDGMTAVSLESLEPLKRSDYTVEVSPRLLILMSQTDTSVELSVQVRRLGLFELRVPFICTSSYVHVDTAVITIESTAPQLRFSLPEINFGLNSVGKESSVQLTLTNESDVSLK